MVLRLRHRRVSRGQALVETALILPILILLLLMAIDFGRVYFTSIDLRNAAHEATMVGGIKPEAVCTGELKPAVDRQMGRSGADGAVCGSLTSTTNIAYITQFGCEGDPGPDCADYPGPYPPAADLRYLVRIEYRFQPVVPLVGFLTGNGVGGSVPIAVENRSPILVGYEGF